VYVPFCGDFEQLLDHRLLDEHVVVYLEMFGYIKKRRWSKNRGKVWVKLVEIGRR
jgi:hypothetical protein